MKKLISAAAVLFVGVSLFAVDISTYVPVNGEVKSYTVTDFAISSQFGDYFRTPEKKEVHVYEDGMEIESCEYTPHDVLVNKITNTYNDAGEVVAQAASDTNGQIIWRNVATYNTKGLLADMSEEGADGVLKSRTIYNYNNSDLLVDETTYDGKGALVWKIVYTYNGENLARESHYYADGLLYEAKEYTYNDNGSVANIATFGPVGNVPMWKEIFRYADGILNEVTTVDRENRTVGRKILRYDGAGNLQRVSDYNIAQKFGTTVNELVDMQEYVYEY